jgi:leucyl aminopeptidase
MPAMIPTSTDVSIQVKDSAPADAEAVVVFATEGEQPAATPGLSGDEAAAVGRLFASGAARGKLREVVFDIVGTGESSGRGAAGRARFRRVYVAGLGKPEKATAESIRQAAGAVTRALRKHRLTRAAVVPPFLGAVNPAVGADAVVTGMLLAAFEYREYKGTAAARKRDEDASRPRPLAVTVVGDPGALREPVERARVVAEGQNFARTIASRPGNDINPPTLAKVAEELAREVGLGVRVLDEKQMAKLGMGGILAVGAGSIATPPRMIVLEWLPGRGGKTRMEDRGSRMAKGGRRGSASSQSSILNSPSSPLLVVGKAITFDTGGISIKPAEKMGKMVYDKCGGMTVLGLMYAIARLKLPVPVVGILSSAENHISSRAYRPGDILRMYNGVTVEVTNTDAEGRLVLGDALAWGIEQYKPQAVIDLATLTGGVIVALGKTMAGVMSNSDTLVDEVNRAAALTGEKLWRLPLGDDQRDYIKSDHADIVNSGGREGHPLQGGAFLSHFVPSDDSVPWAHLDIAGVADTEKELPYYGKGATGWGVRTLFEWVRSKDESHLRHATPRAAGG